MLYGLIISVEMPTHPIDKHAVLFHHFTMEIHQIISQNINFRPKVDFRTFRKEILLNI
jgi:hypothetical protein